MSLAIVLLASTPAATQPQWQEMPASVRLFMETCVDGSARLVGAKPIIVRRMAMGSRKALFRAGRIEYWDPRKMPPVHFPDIGPAYLVSEYPLTYLVPQMPAKPSESSVPVCVILTKDKAAYWGTQRAIRKWAKPGDHVPSEQPGLKVGDGLSSGGIISELTFEAKLGKYSVAVFRESGWIVMRTLDRGNRPHPQDGYKTGKQN